MNSSSRFYRKILTRLFAVLILFSGLFTSGFGQELNASVTVDRSQLNSSSLGFLDDFPSKIESYLNGYDWIDPTFRDKEKININIRVTLLSMDDNYNFEANIIIRSQRPIYHAMQKTTLFLYNDENWMFNYSPNQGLVHDELQFNSVSTLLDFYAYIILGYDFDSFSELGGSPYFSDAQNLVALAQSTSSAGWSRTSRILRNRAQLVADLLNPNYGQLREAIYTYHRLGLDQFVDDPDEARNQIIKALAMIKEAQQNTTGNLLFDTFFNAKYREIVSVFQDAPTDIRLQAYNLLAQIDQSHLGEYDKLQ